MPFPIVDAFLLEPEEGKKGKIAICTNTLAPGMVLNEIPLDQRHDLTLLGSLIVSRDGAERMILNCLAHPTVEYIILFGQETASFCPSTNLLCALMDGYRSDKPGNYIIGAKGVSPHYPNISVKLLEQFRSRVKVIPLFDSLVAGQQILPKYLDWLKTKIPEQIHSKLCAMIAKKKIYYDSLLDMVKAISSIAASGVSAIELDPKDFQHLQPPIIAVEGSDSAVEMPFSVSIQGQQILVDIDCGQKSFTHTGTDTFLMAYSLMQRFNKDGIHLSPFEELWLGAELSRVEMNLLCSISTPSLIRSTLKNSPREVIPLEANSILKADQEYYYKIGIKDKKVCVQSMAHDTCANVFELRSVHISPLLQRLAKENRFSDYEQQMLHRVDVGIEIGRAVIALHLGMNYFQDFHNLFKQNTTLFPTLLVDGDTFLAVHKKAITQIYTRGITVPHADRHKGTMRDSCLLAIFRRSGESLAHLPEAYASGSQTAAQLRADYKEQLLSPENDGTYTYGQRTRAHFGMDQLQRAAQTLRADKTKTVIISRFDPVTDMTLTESPVFDDKGQVLRTRLEATHDPCLTHDIYFVVEGRLHSFHIARAHNIINAYPENIFGLHDAYDETLSNELGIPLGDFFMLSSRANILLLTEEQKAKKIIAEPAKPIEGLDQSMGPHDLSRSSALKGVGIFQTSLLRQEQRPSHPCLDIIEHYRGVNLLHKASDYLKRRGTDHNNPLISCIDPREANTVTPERRLAFFQCNERAGSIHATAVFCEGSTSTLSSDVSLCNYLSTHFADHLGLALGSLTILYTPLRG